MIPKIPISEIKIPKRVRKIISRLLYELKEDIQENGLMCPIIIDNNNTLIDGYYRIQAYKELGFTEIPFTNKDDLEKGDRDE